MGEVIGQRYRIVGQLGKGGFGSVFLADDLQQPGKQFALKQLDVTFSDPKQAQELQQFFDREQKILSWLSHPAIVQRHETLIEGKMLYLVMEHVVGNDLRCLFDERQGPLAHSVACFVAEQVCDILAYLHSQKPHPIVFRDLKPSNLMLTPQGTIKLIDFGIARLHQGGSDPTLSALPMPANEEATAVLGRLQDTTCLGTPGYAAPEQYPGSGMQSDPRADIYALGALMLHLLGRVSPARLGMPLPPLQKVRGDAGAELERIVAKATDPERDKRYPSVRLLAKALNEHRLGRLMANDKVARDQLVKLLPAVKTATPESGRSQKPAERVQARFQDTQRMASTANVTRNLVVALIVLLLGALMLYGLTTPYAIASIFGGALTLGVVLVLRNHRVL